MYTDLLFFISLKVFLNIESYINAPVFFNSESSFFLKVNLFNLSSQDFVRPATNDDFKLV